MREGTMQSYNYPAKNRVRDEWMRFLPPSFHMSTSGLYLPGPENLELPGYQKKGFLPENGFGAEHDQDRFGHVASNAGGMHVVLGSVSDTIDEVRASGQHLSFANLDFDGTAHTFVDQVIKLFTVFPKEPSGCLAVTSFASRNPRSLTKGIENTSKFYSGLEDPMAFFHGYGQMVNRYRALKKQLVNKRTDDHTHLSRELGFLWWLALVLGVIDHNAQGWGVVNHPHLNRIENVLTKIQERSRALEKKDKDFHLVREARLHKRLKRRKSRLWVERFSHLFYYTEQSLPMQTWMFEISHAPSGERPTHAQVLQQMWQLALRAPLIYVDPQGTTITIS